jgi:hypothetical protein
MKYYVSLTGTPRVDPMDLFDTEQEAYEYLNMAHVLGWKGGEVRACGQAPSASDPEVGDITHVRVAPTRKDVSVTVRMSREDADLLDTLASHIGAETGVRGRGRAIRWLIADAALRMIPRS